MEKWLSNISTMTNIVRDNLGSITAVTDSAGNALQRLSYDPWGTLRDPVTLVPFAPGDEPELLLGRGYTGHEHLPWLGLVNMNARLYDPATGRFLNPDPFVQDPTSTQSFNRYSYCLNNPLRYSDPTGELSYYTSDPDEIAWLLKGIKQIGAENVTWNDIGRIWHPDKWFYGEESWRNDSYVFFSMTSVNGGGGGFGLDGYYTPGGVTSIGFKLSMPFTYSSNGYTMADYFSHNNRPVEIQFRPATPPITINPDSPMAYDYVSPTLGIAANGIKEYAPKIGFNASETAIMKNAVGRVGNFAGAVSLLNSILQMNQAQSVDEQVEHMIDAFFDILGFIPEYGPYISLAWNNGGKDLTRYYAKKVILVENEFGLSGNIIVAASK